MASLNAETHTASIGTQIGWGKFWALTRNWKAVWEYSLDLPRQTASAASLDFAQTRVLDIACGERQFAVAHLWRDAAWRAGLDLDFGALEANSQIDLRVCGDFERFPFSANTFDRIVSVDTIEHAPDPVSFLRHLEEVLQPGGKILFFTPNLFGYKTVIAYLGGPHVFKLVWKLFYGKTLAYDAFYRANTQGAIEKAIQGTSLRLGAIYYIAEIPHFFYRSRLLSFGAYAYNRLVLGLGMPWLLNYMMVVLEKQERGAAS